MGLPTRNPEEPFKDHSRMLVRTERGARALEAAVAAGALTATCVSDDPSYRTHRLQTLHKGITAPLRVARLTKQGGVVPTYDRETPPHTARDALKERVISGLIGLRLLLKKRKYRKLKNG
ncbi:MAG: hypothetical protein H8E53_02905 [Planctomycetes bacterium]|nr:hypothetical protein [Planctomycetota bacterium]